MASLAQVSYEDAKALPQNNKNARVYKFHILSEFIPQDAVDQDGDAFHGPSGIIANFNGYNASTMNQLIAEAIAIIDATQQGVYRPTSPAYSPTTPPSLSRRGSDEEMSLPASSSSSTKMDLDDDDTAGPGNAAQQNQEQLALNNASVFDAYQQRVIEIVNEIERYAAQQEGEVITQALMQFMTERVYAIFFGHTPDGTPTDFYSRYGAAPVAGMNATQLGTVAGVATQLDIHVGNFTEQQLGFLREMLATLTNQGASRAAPFNYIKQLMSTVIRIHNAGQALVLADPLFIAHRAALVQEGGMAVLSFTQRLGVMTLKLGVNVTRGILGKISQRVASAYNNWVRIAFRDGNIAIDDFQDALEAYDTVFQSLPPFAQTCWTLPYARGDRKNFVEGPRPDNKPGAALLQEANQAFQTNNNSEGLRLLREARGYVLTEPISTYPAFLTMHPPNDPGPLLHYYGALHGNRSQFLAQGREYLGTEFARNPEEFMRNSQALLSTMTRLEERTRLHRQRGEPSVMTPRTLAAYQQGDTGPYREKVAALSKPAPSSTMSAQRTVFGTKGKGKPDLGRMQTGEEFTTGEQLIKESGGSDTHQFQERSRRQREHEVIIKRQQEIALRAVSAFQQQQQQQWREEMYRNFVSALKDFFNRKVATETTQTATRSGSSTNWEDLRNLLNRRITLTTQEVPSLWQIMLRLNINYISNELIQKLINIGPTTNQSVLDAHHPALVMLSRRLTPGMLEGIGGQDPLSGLQIMIGFVGRQILNAASNNVSISVPHYNQGAQIPAQTVQELAQAIQGNGLFMNLIERYNRTFGGHRAAHTKMSSKQGGRRRKTRKHKKRRKKTRHRRKRGKKTRHKKKKRTRKH